MTIDEQFNQIPPSEMPNHVAIIPNGNRTWARLHGKSNIEGHNTGVEVLIKFSRIMRKWGIHTATVWGTSTENLVRRDKDEISNLFRLFKYVIDTMANECMEDGVRMILLGNRSKLPDDLLAHIQKWEEKTKDNKNFVANVAFAYGGHDELIRAMRKAFNDIEEGKITFDDLVKEDGMYRNKYPYYAFKNYLDTKDQPYPFPDLIIRTAGEHRLSGFMPWQSVYSEYYSTPLLLPEMTEEEFKKAIIAYTNRDRSFGGEKTKI